MAQTVEFIVAVKGAEYLTSLYARVKPMTTKKEGIQYYIIEDEESSNNSENQGDSAN